MRTFEIPRPLLGAIVATRALLGIGIGLLISELLPRNVRKSVGWTLFGIGAASTIPIVMKVVRRPEGANGRSKAPPATVGEGVLAD